MKEARLPQVGGGIKKSGNGEKHRFRKWRRKMSAKYSTHHIYSLSIIFCTVVRPGVNRIWVEKRSLEKIRKGLGSSFKTLYLQ
jgi:hypothetical protein